MNSPTDGQVLKYNNTLMRWENNDETGVLALLDDVGNVNTTTKNDQDVLTWDNTAGEWIA